MLGDANTFLFVFGPVPFACLRVPEHCEIPTTVQRSWLSRLTFAVYEIRFAVMDICVFVSASACACAHACKPLGFGFRISRKESLCKFVAAVPCASTCVWEARVPEDALGFLGAAACEP